MAPFRFLAGVTVAALLVLVSAPMGTWATVGLPADGGDNSHDEALSDGIGDDLHHHFPTLQARIIATGIPGAGAVAETGPFLTGSPLHDRAAFLPFTAPGAVLAPTRVLVASTSNFGAPLARQELPEGTILSIDPTSDGLVVPFGFASAGSQASAFSGAVRVYAAQSPAFLNSLHTPGAVTRDLPSVSLPTAISLNSGNGRPWIANAPYGASGGGAVSVLDPQGFPLAGAPSSVAGGVFFGDVTNREGAAHGLSAATIGTAIITKSPDLTGRAVFAAVGADGSVVQIHVQKGVDILAPPGTLTPLAEITRATAESTAPGVVARSGMAFNWVPTRNLFIADPQANRIVALDLTDDGVRFASTRRTISSPFFNVPIDLAPTTREFASGSFASNTTLGGGSDLYVLNRGNNSIVRMKLDGTVLAVRGIRVSIRGFRANGIAVSFDGQSIYVTGTAADGGGALVSVPSFGQSDATVTLVAQAKQAGQAATVDSLARFFFTAAISPAQGLGPLFNEQSCAACHSSPAVGGMGVRFDQTEQFVGRIRAGGAFDPLLHKGGPTARVHSVSELGVSCSLEPGVTPHATIVSRRNAMTLRGDGLLDDVASGDVLANMALQPVAVRGRPNMLADGRIGKFGWKANVATLVEFMGEAFTGEMGLTNPLVPRDEVDGCHANSRHPELDALGLQAAAAFLNANPPTLPPASVFDPTNVAPSTGQQVFQNIGCASCHTPRLPGPGARVSIYPFSDLLLHDMGPALADQIVQGSARGHEWRTMPLWGLRERERFLHDGRATSVVGAIAAHGGQAEPARNAFANLSPATKAALLAFLGGI